MKHPQATRIAVFSLALTSLIGAGGSADAGQTYRLTSGLGTWTDAEAEAVSLGGHLVSINDSIEQALLVTLFGPFENLWIGFTDQAVEGEFVWTDGSPATFLNWNFGEPNDGIAGGEDFSVMNFGRPGGWNDENDTGSGTGPHRGVIELSGVPEPASLLTACVGGLAALAFRYRRRGARP